MLETSETETERQEQSLQKMFSGVRQLSSDQTINFHSFCSKMDNIRIFMANNQTQLDSSG